MGLKCDYSWIGPPVDTHTKLIPKQTKGLRQIQNHVQKTLGKENLDLLWLFLCDPFGLFFKITSQIASEHKWDDHDRAEYLALNPLLIKKLGGSDKALGKAKKHYLRKGLFKDLSYKLDEENVYGYIQNHPHVVGEIGGTIDPASLAYHFVTSGFDQGHSFWSLYPSVSLYPGLTRLKAHFLW